MSKEPFHYRICEEEEVNLPECSQRHLSLPLASIDSLLRYIQYSSKCSGVSASIGGSVVECSPATRAARIRFPADA